MNSNGRVFSNICAHQGRGLCHASRTLPISGQVALNRLAGNALKSTNISAVVLAPLNSLAKGVKTRAMLILILRFGDPEPANFMLQGRPLESQPFGRSPVSGYPSRGSSQGVDNYGSLGVVKRAL